MKGVNKKTEQMIEYFFFFKLNTNYLFTYEKEATA